ncbi:MAG TPA: cobalamin-binding protein [Spirochaetes bacterium]|nr:cobalamin-binding protein [Spirochaetota bacterium]
MNRELTAVKDAVWKLDIDGIQDAVKNCLGAGIEPWKIIREGMSEGMIEVGRLFESGEYFLADLIMSGEVMREGMLLLEDKIGDSGISEKGTVVVATVKGDIHDIGKKIVGMMLSASGYRVVDLGADEPEDKIVEAVRKNGAGGIALSSLLTTMIGSIRDVVNALHEAGLRDKVKIAIGGACTSEKLAAELGVDAYGADAVQAVRIFDKLLN